MDMLKILEVLELDRQYEQDLSEDSDTGLQAVARTNGSLGK